MESEIDSYAGEDNILHSWFVKKVPLRILQKELKYRNTSQVRTAIVGIILRRIRQDPNNFIKFIDKLSVKRDKNGKIS